MDGPTVGKKPQSHCADGYHPISHLPDELVEKILSLLSSPCDRCNSALVSKKWLLMLATMQVADRGRTTSSRCLTERKANDFRLAALALRAYSRGSLTTLFVAGAANSFSISDHGLEIIAKASPRLTSLTLMDCISVGDAGLKSVAQWCKDLHLLDVTNCPLLTDEGLMSVASNSLKLSILNLESCWRIGSESLVVFANMCKMLKSISISKCPLIGDSGIVSLVSNLPELVRMKLAILNIGDCVLEAIALRGKALISLHLEKIKGPTAAGYSRLGASEKLICLKLKSCHRFSGDSFTMPIVNNFACLDQLEIKKCCTVTDDAITALSTSSRLMRILRLEECTGFTLGGLMATLANWALTLKELSLTKCYIIEGVPLGVAPPPPLPENYPSLTTLELKQCAGVGDLFLSCMSLACDKVKNVRLAGTGSITDRGLMYLLARLNVPNNLSSLDLSGCAMISEQALYSVVTAHGARLRSLRLAGCRGVNDRMAALIAAHCFRLEELNVDGCATTDVAVWFLMHSRHSKLQVLNLAGCTGITDSSLIYLQHMVRGEPVMLDIRRCPRLSARGIDLLQKVLLGCEVIY